MRCSTIRRNWLDVELGLASRQQIERIEAHLGGCPACTDWCVGERELTGALVGRRVPIEFPIDVTSGVLARIAELDPPHRGAELSGRQAGWFSAAAAMFGTALLISLWRLAPTLPPLADAAREVFTGLGHLATALATPLLVLLATLARSLGRVGAAMQALSAPLEQMGPVAMAIIGLCTAMMTTSILLVLRRDLTRPAWTREN